MSAIIFSDRKIAAGDLVYLNLLGKIPTDIKIFFNLSESNQVKYLMLYCIVIFKEKSQK